MTESESEEEYENEIKLEGCTFTRLTDLVRNQYLKYLKKQLEENMKTCWREGSSLDENFKLEALVQECAKHLDDLAVKEATLAQLYQRAMVKMIDSIRRCTEERRLTDEMQVILDSNKPKTLKCTTASKATQTEDYEEAVKTLTLDERIDLFQKQLNPIQSDALMTDNYASKSNSEKRKHETDRTDYCRKRVSRRRLSNKESKALKTPVLHSPTPPPQPTPQNISKNLDETFEAQLAGDEVAEELEKLFMEQETDLEEIFGISLSNKLSICDNEKSPEKETKNETPKEQTHAPLAIAQEESARQISTSASTPNPPTNQNSQLYRQPVNDLRHSPWPCECFMQRRRLSATLTRLVEEDIRWFDILQLQFSLLFGDFGDAHADFAPCSPSLDLDEITISSCMRRISPWIVRHLMKPLQDGLIGNRFLFKKLAKKLAYHIILENQYPNELVIKNAIENFFCLHRAVMTADDLDDVDGLRIVNEK